VQGHSSMKHIGSFSVNTSRPWLMVTAGDPIYRSGIVEDNGDGGDRFHPDSSPHHFPVKCTPFVIFFFVVVIRAKVNLCSLTPAIFTLCEAFLAVNRTISARFKGDGAFFPAVRANRLVRLPLSAPVSTASSVSTTTVLLISHGISF
jgi:hypothetical protein